VRQAPAAKVGEEEAGWFLLVMPVRREGRHAIHALVAFSFGCSCGRVVVGVWSEDRTMAKKQGESVHVRLPLETLEEVDALARELGESRSEAVRALMAPSIRRRVNARAKGAA